MKKADDTETLYFFDKEEYLLVMKREAIKNGELKGKDHETLYSDYRELNGGCHVAFQVDIRIEGKSQLVLKYSKGEANIDIDDDQFKMPE